MRVCQLVLSDDINVAGFLADAIFKKKERDWREEGEWE